MSVWDMDGVDSFTLAKLLAGNTKPLVRLIGAPYWAENRFLGNRLEDVIELERMERSWHEGDDIEVFSEGGRVTAFRPPIWKYSIPRSVPTVRLTAF